MNSSQEADGSPCLFENELWSGTVKDDWFMQFRAWETATAGVRASDETPYSVIF